MDALPTQGCPWICDIINIESNQLNDDGTPMKSEKQEFWRRDPVECMKHLLGDPTLRDSLAFAPERIYVDEAGTQRKYSQMWTANWWWDTQVRQQHCRVGYTDQESGKLTCWRNRRTSNPIIRQNTTVTIWGR
jgi:hypothetical protein